LFKNLSLLSAKKIKEKFVHQFIALSIRCISLMILSYEEGSKIFSCDNFILNILYPFYRGIFLISRISFCPFFEKFGKF
jgi:hypothetical protein